MIKTTVTSGLLLLFSLIASAELPDDFQAAVGLYQKKDYAGAHEAFVKVAETAPTPKSKSECLAFAAACLGKLKQYGQAIELAQTIPVKPIAVNCQMEIMLENGKQKELIEAFKDENISAWPDYLIHHGFYNRGCACRLAGNAEAAAKDLEQAVETSNTTGHFQVRVLSDLAGVRSALKQDDKALEAYRRVLAATEYKGLYTFCGAAIAAPNILIKQGKYDEALLEINKFDPLPTSGVYKIQAMEVYGDIYAGQGKKDEAKAKYLEALKDPGISKGSADKINGKLGALSEK